MFLKKLLSRLFSTESKSHAQKSDPVAPDFEFQSGVEAYFIEEIAASPYIRSSGRAAVLDDFLQKNKLSSGEPLSLAEKKALGLNTRLKITREQYQALTLEGVNLNPKHVLQAVYLKATFNHSRRRDIARMKSAGFSQYSPMSCRDNRDCDWCTSMDGKPLPIDVDFVQLIKENCTCDYCRCVVQAKLSV